MIDFSVVRRDHVLKALEDVRREGVPAKFAARSATIVDGVHEWPVKYVLGKAYSLATGQALSSELFSGGMAAGDELLRRGFAVRHGGKCHTPPMAIVSVCIRGRPPHTEKANNARVALIDAAMSEVENHGIPVSAAVLPGGCFFLDEFIGDYSFEKRRRALEEASFASCCTRAAKLLRKKQPGALLIVGVDTIRHDDEASDQLCVAWSDDRVVGIGRKVFPAGGEIEDLVVRACDFGARERLVVLAGARRAMLCSCYENRERLSATGRRSRCWSRALWGCITSRAVADAHLTIRAEVAPEQCLWPHHALHDAPRLVLPRRQSADPLVRGKVGTCVRVPRQLHAGCRTVVVSRVLASMHPRI